MKKIGGFQFITGFILGAVVFGGVTAFAAGITAAKSTSKILVNGEEIRAEAYSIEGRNYLRLRDIAAAINFSIVWDGSNNQVLIDTGRNYDPNETLPATANPQTQTASTRADGANRPDYRKCGLDIWLDGDYAVFENECEAIRLINDEREKAGLTPVTVNLDLCKVARIKAVEMAELGSISHQSPEYGKPAEMVKGFGLNYKAVGENVAYLGGAYASGVVNNWMRSEGHKSNILIPKYTEAGIGFAIRDGIGYWSLFLAY